MRLKTVVDRFNQVAQSLKAQSARRDIDIQLATQLRQITLIMEDMLLRINNIYQASLEDLKGVVGVAVVDETLWPRIKAETDEEAKVQNLDYYEKSVIGVSQIAENMVDLSDKDSDALKLLEHLQNLARVFKEKQGIWGTGYDFLSKEWQEKISFQKLDQNLSDELKQLKQQMAGAIEPLWRTCRNHYKEKGQQPLYERDQDGFLKKAK